MASLAPLSREERIGLCIAAAAHVALVAALVFHVQDDPAGLPIPERMDVSLASEISLESTAPDPSAEPQAAIAPVLSPEPAPVAEPEPAQQPVVREQARPQPTRQAARPAPAPQPAARAREAAQPPSRTRPQETQARAGGSRIGADFLEGTAGSQRTETRGSPAATFGPAQQASLQSAINRKLRPHWSAPSGVDAERLVTVLSWELDEDGSLRGRPQVVRQSGITDSNRPQAPLHAERAIRAVQLAAPFDLPQEFYSRWRRLTWEFDRNLSQ